MIFVQCGNEPEGWTFLEEKVGCGMPLVETFWPVENITVYVLIAAVFEALAVYLFQFRKTPGAMMLVCCQLCKGIWVWALAFCSMNPELPAKLFWARVTEWMPLLLIYFWFEFIWKVSQPRVKLLTALPYVVRGIVVVLVLIIGFDGWLGWYWGPITPDGQALSIAFGPAARANMLFCYLLNLVCLGLSVYWIYSTNGLRRQQAIVLSVTPLFNFIGNIMGYVFNFQVVSPQMIGMLISAVYVTWFFYHWRIYSILPMAQDAVTRNMNDGLIVIDEKGYIVDMNPAAQAIFTEIPVHVGRKFAEAAVLWPVLGEIDGDTRSETLEAERNIANEHRFYQISTLLFTTPQGHRLGKTVLFKEITELKRNQARLIDQQKALSIMAERERLGRELHDGQGQLWSYINMQVEAARSLLEKQDVEKADLLLEKLAGITQDVHVDLRESITGLQLADMREGVWQTIEEYLQWFEQNYGIKTQLMISEKIVAGLLPQTTEVQLLRIVQEALTNIRKHANAQQVKIIVQINNGAAEIWVEDDGSGVGLAAGSEKKGSFGLKIMQERAAEIGAQFYINSKLGAGTTVVLRIPLPAGKNIGTELPGVAERKGNDESAVG